MSLFKRSNKNETYEQKYPELAEILKLNPRYFEEKAHLKMAREVKRYL